LAIGGGTNGRYIVYVAYDDESFRQAGTKSPPAEPTLWIVAGGQAGDYPACECLTLGEAVEAVEAATVWARTGELTDALTWHTT
jgi:hypothetical protein